MLKVNASQIDILKDSFYIVGGVNMKHEDLYDMIWKCGGKSYLAKDEITKNTCVIIGFGKVDNKIKPFSDNTKCIDYRLFMEWLIQLPLYDEENKHAAYENITAESDDQLEKESDHSQFWNIAAAIAVAIFKGCCYVCVFCLLFLLSFIIPGLRGQMARELNKIF